MNAPADTLNVHTRRDAVSEGSSHRTRIAWAGDGAHSAELILVLLFILGFTPWHTNQKLMSNVRQKRRQESLFTLECQKEKKNTWFTLIISSNVPTVNKQTWSHYYSIHCSSSKEWNMYHISCLHNADWTHGNKSSVLCVCVCVNSKHGTYRASVSLRPVLSFRDLCLLAPSSVLLMLSVGLLEFLLCLGQHVLVELQAFFLFLQGILQSGSQGFIIF